MTKRFENTFDALSYNVCHGALHFQVMSNNEKIKNDSPAVTADQKREGSCIQLRHLEVENSMALSAIVTETMMVCLPFKMV